MAQILGGLATRFESSNIVLLFYSGILPCYCCYSHASLAIMLILCSFHNWENTLNLKRDKRPSDWHLSLPALHCCCCHWWSECYCPDAGCRFSKFSQLTLPNLFAAMWQFAYAPCYYSSTMLNCFWLAIIPTLWHYAQHNQLKPTSEACIFTGAS